VSVIKILFDPKDVAKLQWRLNQLPRNVQHRQLRIALNAWGGEVRNVAKRSAAKETGILRRSLRVKVKIPAASFNPTHRTKPAYVVVGPGKGIVGPARRNSRGQLRSTSLKRATKTVLTGGTIYTRRPSRYAHLVEKGVKGHSRAQPFISRGQAVGNSQYGLNILRAKLRQGIEAEALKIHAN
jgi:hypothetical protein